MYLYLRLGTETPLRPDELRALKVGDGFDVVDGNRKLRWKIVLGMHQGRTEPFFTVIMERALADEEQARFALLHQQYPNGLDCAK